MSTRARALAAETREERVEAEAERAASVRAAFVGRPEPRPARHAVLVCLAVEVTTGERSQRRFTPRQRDVAAAGVAGAGGRVDVAVAPAARRDARVGARRR